MAEPKKDGKLIVGSYRKARFHYEILEEHEAGLELKGPEVKSLRNGKVTLDGSFARADGDQLYLHNLYIAPYVNNTIEDISPTRTRRLLMHRREIAKLSGKHSVKGMSLIPLEIYFKRGWAKVLLAVAKGKRGPDKRDSIKKKDAAREMEREFKGKFKL
ncbi:MAG: SsrA-binding protein SmpB [Elusimicrobia bacterium]|nr:SsrA-binding protein SmpB [Elusimicrobiota bacterium]